MPSLETSLVRALQALPSDLKKGIAWGAGIALVLTLFKNPDH